MINNYQSLLDMIRPQEEDQIMSPMPQDQLETLQPAPEVTPEVAPEIAPEAVSNQPQDNNNQAPLPPVDRRQALLDEFQKLRSGTDELAEARRIDRRDMILGQVGDALATIAKGYGLKESGVPGVQIKSGAGLAEMVKSLQTAPELASDLTQRRQALMDEYRLLAEGKKLENSPNAWQIIPIVKDGVQKYVSVNKITNEVRPIGEKATYKQFRVDPSTGFVEGYDPIKGTKATTRPASDSFNTSLSGKKEEQNDLNFIIDETKKRFNPNQKKILETTIKEFNADTKEERNTLGSISNLRTTLDMSSDNRAAAKAFGTQLAKVFQDGRLSDKDVDLYIKDTDLIQKVRTGYFDMVSGTIDPAKIPEYRSLIRSMEQGLQNNITTKADYFATQRLGDIVDDPIIRRELIYPMQRVGGVKKTQQETIIRRDPKSGRRVEYDATTKKPIRFVD